MDIPQKAKVDQELEQRRREFERERDEWEERQKTLPARDHIKRYFSFQLSLEKIELPVYVKYKE